MNTRLLAAATNPEALDIGPGGGITPANVDVGSGPQLADVLSQFWLAFTWIVGVAAIFSLLMAGFNYLTAGGDTDKAATARRQVVYSIVGIIIATSTFFIYNAARNLAGAETAAEVEDAL